MGKHPFNLRLPDDAEKVVEGDKHIGWVWTEMRPLTRVDKSLHNVAEKFPRWASCMLDGVICTRNSRTRDQAIRVLKRDIAYRARGDHRYGARVRLASIE